MTPVRIAIRITYLVRTNLGKDFNNQENNDESSYLNSL